MKRFLLLALSMVLVLASFVGCSETSTDTSSAAESVLSSVSSAAESSETDASAEKTQMNVLAIAGPTGIGMAKLMEEDSAGETANDYTFTITSTPSDVMTAIVSGAADIAACPINLAAKINTKTNGGIQVLAVNTLGVLYIVTNGVEIHDFTDLDGMEIVASGEGATPEFAMKYLCEAYDIDVSLQFVDEFSTAATMVAGGQCQVALLAEPSVSSARAQNSELTVSLNLTEIWRTAGEEGKIANVELAQGCVIVRKEFAESNPDAVQAFLDEYALSVAYAAATENLEDVAALCETYSIVPKAAIAKMAIPNCNLVCITGAEMKTVIEENLNVLYNYDPSSIGGAVPSDDFYYGS